MDSQHGTCTKHIPAFDEAAARVLIGDWRPSSDVDFIVGNPAAQLVRKKWPRWQGTCECGFEGISYASAAHYALGDW